MRKLVYLLAFFCTTFYYAQTNGITYQAVIYLPNGQNIPGQDIQNSPMTNKFVCLKFSLIDDASQIEYQETIQTTTDEFGMVNLIIGSGTQIGGYASSFNAVVWNNTQKKLKVELDPRGTCQEYIVLSDNPLSAVPFAYAAVTANNVSGTVAVFNGGTGANNPTDAKINLGLGNVDNTSDLNKPISTATQAALITKEALSNKSTTPTLGTSDVLYPTQNAVKTYVDTQVAAATIPDATATTKGKIQLAGDLGGTAAAPTVPALATKENTITAGTTSQYFRGDKTWQTLDKSVVGLNNVDNTSDLNKPISTATQTALNAKENAANKSTTTTLGTSDVLFPTQNAVKSYVDTNITTVNNTIAANATAATNAIAAVQADVNANEATSIAADNALQNSITTLQNTVATNATNTTAALALKENAANKSAATTLGTSDVLFPTQNAVKTYVDTQVAAATIPDATATTKGKIQLAGDLGGTAAAPTVPALATKENTITAGTTSQYYRGDKTWQTLDKSVVGLNNVDNTSDLNKPISTATQTALNAKENAANKSTTTTLGTSDVLFPTQNAVKSYVDTNITTVNNTIGANATAATTAIAAVQADVDANETATNNALALKENAANKSTTTTLGTSDVLFPTQNAVKSYVDTNITTVNNTIAANATAATTAIAAVQADVDANETATNNALALKENAANKSTTTTLGTSDVLFPTQNAVKTYVDTNITTVNNTITTNATAATTAIAAVQADVDANETATNNALALKENAANKSTTTTLGTSDVLFPTQNAVKSYVDAQVASATIADADTNTKGKIQLAGDLGGTAASPTVPGLANKENLANKSTDVILDGTSDVKYPSVKATKDYVDSQIAAGVVDADSSTKGKIQLAGDLTGTAASPAVAAGAITNVKLANDAVTTSKILDGTIVAADIANNAVEEAKIKDTAVTYAKIQNVADNKVLGNFSGSTGSVQELATTGSGNVVRATSPTLTTPTLGVATATSVNKVTITAPTTSATLTIADGKTLSATDNATISGTNTGDQTITLTGDVTGSGTGSFATTLSGSGVTAGTYGSATAVPTITVDSKGRITSASATTISGVSPVGSTLTNGNIIIGNGSNVAAAVAVSGDVTITNAGVTAIGTGKVVTAMLATDAVETAKIKDANVTTAKLANDAVETAKIKNANVTNAKLDKANIPLSGFGAAAAAVDLGSNKLINVTDPTAAQDAATKNYVDTATSGITTLDDGKIYLGNASNVATEVTPTGDVTITNAGVTAIGTGKVVTAMLANDAVTTAKITDANVTTDKLAADAVTTSKILDGTIVAADIANNAVTYAKIQNVADNKVLGNFSGSTGSVQELATTGTGNVVRATSPTLVTPNLGTPSAIDLTNATALPLTAGAGVTGVLPVANGGTGSNSQNFVDLTTAQTVAGAKTFSGNTAVGGTLGVTGATTLSSTLAVTGNTTIGGTSTLNGNTAVSGSNTFTVGTGATALGGTLTVTGATTLNGNTAVSGSNTLTVGTGATTLGGTLGVTGATTLSSTLSAGASTLASASITNNATVGGTLGVTGATTLGSTLGVTGNTSISATTASTTSSTGALTVAGGVGIAGALNVGGNTVFTGTIEIDGGSPGDGKVLTSNANGLASWSNALGSAVTTTNTSYPITLAESVVFYTGTAAGTFTIPAAATANAGKEITIKNKTAFTITITPASGNIYIDNENRNAANVRIGIEASNNWIKLVSDGTQWNVLRALF
jgi:hypothetical protein